MDVERLREMLERVKTGEMPIDDAISSLRTLPFEDLGFAQRSTGVDRRASRRARGAK